MAKKNKTQEKFKKEVLSTKESYIKFAKRYGITLAIAMPIILIVSYVLNTSVSWYNGAVSFFCGLAMILLACFIALIIFNKIDEKRESEQDYEKQRDPFAD